MDVSFVGAAQSLPFQALEAAFASVFAVRARTANTKAKVRKKTILFGFIFIVNSSLSQSDIISILSFPIFEGNRTNGIDKN